MRNVVIAAFAFLCFAAATADAIAQTKRCTTKCYSNSDGSRTCTKSCY